MHLEQICSNMMHTYNFSPLHLLLWSSLPMLILPLSLPLFLPEKLSVVSPLDPLYSPSFLFGSLCHLSFMCLAKACWNLIDTHCDGFLIPLFFVAEASSEEGVYSLWLVHA